MSDDNLKLVLVGHVDHGKSTLIGRLFYDTDSLPDGKIEEIKQICEALGKDIEFGYVMDNLSEERDQGITIDTAQKFFTTSMRRYTIIDAPGHVEFVKNMITGASHADAAILLVDVEEGVKEQTRRHAYILGMLGLNQVIVAMNKMDKVGFSQDRFEQVKIELLEFLSEINIHPTYIIPISAKDGDFIAKKSENLKWFEGLTILEALDTFNVPESESQKPLRFPVQDVYKWDEKRIIAGRISTGSLEEDMEIIALPSGEKSRIEKIQQWKSDKKDEFGPGEYENPLIVEAGRSTGFTLKDQLFLDRGDIIVSKDDPPKITDQIKAELFWMDKNPYKKGERIIIKLSSQEMICEIEKINRVINSSNLEVISTDSDEIKNREVADVIIKTSKPIVIENFNKTAELGRFVLNRQDTVAGGIITEVD